MRRIEALRRPLELAAANAFAGVRKVAGLGNALRVACDGVIQKAPNDALAAWRATLGNWEQLGEHQQAVEVARGMRLIAKFGKPARPAQPTPPATATSRQGTPPLPDDPLVAPTRTLPGIGPAFAERLAAKGLETVEDLLWMVPRRYDDVRHAKPLAEVARMDEGQRVTFVAKVVSARMVFVRGRRWAEVRLGASDLDERGASAVVRWFNVWAGIDKRMPPAASVTLSGVVRKRDGKLTFANPDILAIDVAGAERKEPASIIARYPEIAGVPGSKLRAACQAACARVGASVDDGVPASVERAARLPSLGDTLAQLHHPPAEISVDELAALNRGDSRWQRRLAFGELFALGIAVAMRRRERRGDAAVPCPRANGLDAAIGAALPFAPTRAQVRSIRELGDDLAADSPMNRLLQGDVGSGKTCVAFAAALQVAKAGRQTAVMAPTELLAEQHA
jgi:ATP-dependent DNA helicase RecG